MGLFTRTILSFEFPVDVADGRARDKIAALLDRERYRHIRIDPSFVYAKRGSWFGWLIGGDPRRLPHTIRIEAGSICYSITTQLLLWFTDADRRVFQAECEFLLAAVEGRTLHDTSMQEVQRARLKTDIRNWMIFVVVVAIIVMIIIR